MKKHPENIICFIYVGKKIDAYSHNKVFHHFCWLTFKVLKTSCGLGSGLKLSRMEHFTTTLFRYATFLQIPEPPPRMESFSRLHLNFLNFQ